MKRILALCLMSIIIFTGCSNGTAAPEAEESQSAEASNVEKVAKEEIVFAQGADISSLDPHIGKQLRAVVVTTNIFDTLVEFDQENNLVPGLAESWEYLSDTSIKFTLKSGVKFHDGSPLTSADAKFSLERAMASSHVSNYVNFISDIQIEDDLTFIVNTAETYAPSISVFTTNLIAIVPKDYIEEVGDEAFALAPVGTGRYKFVEWKQGEYCTLEAFEDCHWGAPATKYLKMQVVPENSQRTIMLETGEIDIAYEVLPNDVAKIKENDSLIAMTSDTAKVMYLSINTTSDGPLGNADVRKAIEHAIDKQLLVDTVLYGYGSVADVPLSPLEFGYSDNYTKSEYNLEKAKSLLAEAGYADGFTMTIMTDNNQAKMEYCQIIQSMLSEIGITVEISTLDSSALTAALKEDYDAAMMFFNPLTGDGGHTLYTLFYSTSSTNRTKYNNPEVDTMLLNGLVSLNPEERLAIYADVLDILREDMPMIPLYFEGLNVGMKAGVEDFELKATGMHEYKDTIIYN